jgi:hypothetical protein
MTNYASHEVREALSQYERTARNRMAAAAAFEALPKAERKAGEFLGEILMDKGGGDTSTGNRVKPVHSGDGLSGGNIGLLPENGYTMLPFRRMGSHDVTPLAGSGILESRSHGETLNELGSYKPLSPKSSNNVKLEDLGVTKDQSHRWQQSGLTLWPGRGSPLAGSQPPARGVSPGLVE